MGGGLVAVFLNQLYPVFIFKTFMLALAKTDFSFHGGNETSWSKWYISFISKTDNTPYYNEC